MNTEAALAVMGALWIGTVACRELHCILLIRTVCHVSGVYSKCSRSPFVFIHAIEGQHRKTGVSTQSPGQILRDAQGSATTANRLWRKILITDRAREETEQ